MLKAVRSTLLALGLVCVAFPTLASTIVIEPWTTPLPPNPCLVDSHAEVLFTGPYCDGPSCPPAIIRIGPCNGGIDFEYNLLPASSAGTLLRRIYSGGAIVSSAVLPATQRLTFRNEVIPAWICELDYDWTDGPYDMAAHGVDQIEFEVTGAPGLSQPLYLFVELSNGDGNQMTVHKVITEPGLVTLPFTDFDTTPGFDASQLRSAIIDLESCPDPDCVGVPQVPAGGFSLGPISFHSTLPTPTKQRSWSQVKSIYR